MFVVVFLKYIDVWLLDLNEPIAARLRSCLSWFILFSVILMQYVLHVVETYGPHVEEEYIGNTFKATTSVFFFLIYKRKTWIVLQLILEI